MKKLIVLCFVFNLFTHAYAQNWTWAETAGGILPDEANGCAIDSSGNMYVSGFFFSSSINFNSGNSLSNSGICEGFIVKYNTQGKSVWASRIKGNAEDKATGCAVDNAGNVITTGYFDSPSLQFGGNNAHNISNSNGSGGTFDAFIVKYNALGTPQWFHAIGKNDDDGGNSVAADNNGNVYVTGWFRAPSINVGNITLYNKHSAGGTSDMFLIKYDPNGNVLWAKNAGSLDDDKGTGCAIDPWGNVIVTGYFKGSSIDFEGTLYPNSGSKDFFVAKYDSSGTLLTTKVYGGSGGEEAFDCAVDGYGNVFICGNYSSNTVVFDADTLANTGSSFGAFLLKLDTALNTLWVRGASSSNTDEAKGCSADKYGNSVVTGVYSGSSITFGNTVLNNNGGDEIFLVKYDPNGNQLWAKKAGKSKDDGSNGCSIDNNGKVLIAGYYNSSSLTFGNIDLDNSYIGITTSDVFVVTTCNTNKGNDTITACDAYTWIDGNTYYTDNNTAAYIMAGSGNTCDSMVLLHLTLAAVDTSVAEAIPTFTANAVNATYQWLDCGNNFAVLADDTNQTFTATTTGNYAVAITQHGCTDTSTCFAVTIVNTAEMNTAENFKIFPNPASNNITIQHATANMHMQYQIDIFNQAGQKVYAEKTNRTSTTISLQLFPAGIYFVQLKNLHATYTKKLVIAE